MSRSDSEMLHDESNVLNSRLVKLKKNMRMKRQSHRSGVIATVLQNVKSNSE